jgi:hypothetical protein
VEKILLATDKWIGFGDTLERRKLLRRWTENNPGDVPMSNVRQLIEQFAAEEQQQFARGAERFGDDLERAWAESEDGAGLLWLAVIVGVDPKQIVATACQLLEGVVEQIKTTSQETTQILEAVHAWEKGEQSTDEVIALGVDVYRLIEDLDESPLVAPEVEEVVTAAIWLTNLVVEIPPQIPPDEILHDDLLEQGTWCLVDHLAHAQALHQGWGGSDDDPPEGYQHAYAEAMRRFAITIREGITGAQVQTAAQQRGIWPR